MKYTREQYAAIDDWEAHVGQTMIYMEDGLPFHDLWRMNCRRMHDVLIEAENMHRDLVQASKWAEEEAESEVAND